MDICEFITVILAAGKGTRLGALNSGKAKALLKINGKRLIEYAIEFALDAGSTKIYAIGGQDFEEFHSVILKYSATRPEIESKIKIIENKNLVSGNLSSLLSALPEINTGFLLCNADHIYNKQLRTKIIPQFINGTKDIIAFCDNDRILSDDDMKVLSENYRIKEISKKLVKYDYGYVGLTFCPKNMLQEYKKTAKIVFKENNGNAAVEQVLAKSAQRQNGNKIKIADISGWSWIEIDNGKDYKKALKILQKNVGDF